MRFIVSLCAIISAFTITAQTGVQSPAFESADKIITRFMDEWDIKGGAVAITKGDKLIYNKGFGTAGDKPAGPNTLFRIASVSKPITSIAVMKLVQQGRLSLNDKVFGPDALITSPYYVNVISDKRIYDITVQQLLEHTAGWDRNMPCDGYSHSDPAFFPLHVAAAEHESNPVGDSTLIKFSLRKGIHHQPGTKYSYSNVGYLVLGKIIEAVSGTSYEQFVKQNVFAPVGVYDIKLGRNLYEDRDARESKYFGGDVVRSAYGDGKRVPWQYGGFNVEAMNAHGGWIASAADLTKLLMSIDGTATAQPLLNSAAVKLMAAPGAVNSSYAKGWQVNNKNTWWHTGSLDGSASFVCKTADGYTWAFLFNSRADNSSAFWKAFDRLPWNCIKVLPADENMDLYAPALNASALKIVSAGKNSIRLSWKPGDGDGRLVVVTDGALTGFPADGREYSKGNVRMLDPKAVMVWSGDASAFTLQGLDPSKAYEVHVFEYFSNAKTGGQRVYKLADSASGQIVTDPLLVANP